MVNADSSVSEDEVGHSDPLDVDSWVSERAVAGSDLVEKNLFWIRFCFKGGDNTSKSRLLFAGVGHSNFCVEDLKKTRRKYVKSLPRCKLQQTCRYSVNRFARSITVNDLLFSPEYRTPLRTQPDIQKTL